jgi:hypothetical protein
METPTIDAVHKHFEKVNSNPIKPLRDFLERISLVTIVLFSWKPSELLLGLGPFYTSCLLNYLAINQPQAVPNKKRK